MSRPKAQTELEWKREMARDLNIIQRQGRGADLALSGSIKTGLLDDAYRGPGPASVLMDDWGTEIGPLEWMGQYQPHGSRRVNVARVGGAYRILGHNDEGLLRPTLTSNWIAYDLRQVVTEWRWELATLLPSGIVVLGGLINSKTTPATDELIMTLPVGMRPDYDWVVSVNQADVARLLVIKANGEVRAFGSGWTNGFVSLDGIAFPAAGVADWMNVGDAAQPWINTWGPYQSATFGPPRTWLDPYGMVWAAGCVQGGSFTDSTPIFQLPPDRRGYAQHHMHTGSGGGYGMVGHNSTPFDRINVKGGNTGAFISLHGAVWATAAGRSDNAWFDVPYYSNGWQRYSPTEFTIPSMLRRQDGLGMLGGFISTGTLGAAAFILQRELWPDRRLLLQSGANSTRARLAIGGRNQLVAGTLYPEQGSNAWFSLDSKMWLVA